MTRQDWNTHWQRQTFDAALRAIGEGRENKSERLAARILVDLWDHRGSRQEVTPRAVVERVYKDEIPSRSDDKRPFAQRAARPLWRLRTAVTEVRSSLPLFFATDAGRRLPFRMAIDEGAYELLFTPNQLELKRFWLPMIDGRQVQLMFNAPLFLRHRKRRAFIRFLDMNRETKVQALARRPGRMLRKVAASPILEALVDEQAELIPRRSYTTVGEMEAVIGLTELCRGLGIPVATVLSHRTTSVGKDVHHVMLGNVRTNPLTLGIPSDLVRVRQRPRSLIVKGGDERLDDIKPFGHAFGLITRLANWPAEGVATVVLAANHAPGIGTLARLVTDETEIATLLQESGVADRFDLPNTLEIVICFQLDGNENVAAYLVDVAFSDHEQCSRSS